MLMILQANLLVPLAIASGVLAWIIAHAIRIKAANLKLVQEPNERSSHSTPTPSGGGIGIAAAGTLSGLLLVTSSPSSLMILIVTSIIAILGFLDDMHDLSSRLRFGVQALLVSALVATAWPMPGIPIGGVILPGEFVSFCLVFASLWWVNLFNFMDGIDGIAASEGIFILASAAIIWFVVGPDAAGDAIWWWGICGTCACVGFLVVNCPPARIFMGDAGSNYIAMLILGIAIYTISHGWLSYSTWLILMCLFVVDATTTLARRIIVGERWLSAHRSHGYQRLSRRWRSHGRVTLLFITVNVIWLLPLAYLSTSVPEQSWLFLIASYVPAIVGAVLIGSGKSGELAAAG